MINDKVDPFINQYRDALERNRDLSFQNLDNTRRNDYGSIMGNANTSGMMYSNFPERTKIQYDTQTYMPSQTKIQNTYQTGLDKLRSNTVNLSNQLKDINDAIADLKKTGNNTNSNLKYNTYDFKNGYVLYGTPGKEALYLKDGQQISRGEFLEGTGKSDVWSQVWDDDVKTDGVGPDTVNAYGAGGIDRNDPRYSYLYTIQ